MSTDKIPVPLQAISGVLVPAVASGVYFLVSAIASSGGSDPQTDGESSRSALLLLVALTILIVGSFLQYRYVRRSMQRGLMDSAASPLVITGLTVVGAVVGLALLPYLPTGNTSVSTPWNRNAISFAGFIELLIIWLSACGGLMMGGRADSSPRSR